MADALSDDDVSEKARKTFSTLLHYDALAEYYWQILLFAVLTLVFLIVFNPKPQSESRRRHRNKTVHVICDEQTCNDILNKELQQAAATQNKTLVFGFDCETTPSSYQRHAKSYKVGLVQLASKEDIYLIRLNLMNYAIPDALKIVLSTRNIVKCGVGIYGDACKLFTDCDVATLGVIELTDMLAQSSFVEEEEQQTLQNNSSSSSVGGKRSLCDIYETTCQQSMACKDKKTTLSHWNTFHALSDKQIEYAADDANAAYEIFFALLQDIHGIIDDDEVFKECRSLMDVTKIKKQTKSIVDNSNNGRKKQQQSRGHDQGIKYRVLRPNGVLLFFCGKFQFEWFALNGLADRMDDTSCRLIFANAPTNATSSQDDEKTEYSCFVCGAPGNDERVQINRFDIFADCYWKFLQNEEIAQRALVGNMIPLCHKSENDCFSKGKQFHLDCMRWFCQQHQKVCQHPDMKKSDEAYRKAKAAASALDKSHENIPMQRRIELVRCVADYFALSYSVENMDTDAADSKTHFMNLLSIESDTKEESGEVFGKCMRKLLKDEKEELMHCKQLVSEYKGREQEFVELWRNKFVEEMKPGFVPSYWPLARI